MAGIEPVAELDPRFSSPDATPTPWAEASRLLAGAKVFWLSTMRPDGRPHVTPLIAVWLDGAVHFCTGPSERMAKNLAGNAHCVLTTFGNALAEGFDLVVEGDAVRVSDETRHHRLADRYESNYGSNWHFTVRDGAFFGDGGEALADAVAPTTAFGFHMGEPFGQTRWRF